MDRKPEGLDGELARKVIKVMSAVNVRVYRLTRGRIGGTWRVGAAWRRPVPICLLEHRGRRTGKLRTSPLVYLRDGDRVVVVASQAGRPKHPLWYLNLEADPDVTVQIRGDRQADARAHRIARGAGGAVAATGRALQRLRLLPVVDRARDPGRGPRTR